MSESARTPLLEVCDLVVEFPSAGRVLDGVTLSLDVGERLALVGASGCGKTTLARAILNLQPPTSGDIRIGGESIYALKPAALKALRQRVQGVFQDPGGSLNDRMRVGTIVGEPLLVLRGLRGTELAQAVGDLLESVGLEPSDAKRWPHQFSGGQKQRIAMARALSIEPDLLICDEPTSALDVSVQARVLNLLMRQQRERSMAMVMVTHDLPVAVQTCDRIAVMENGRIIEDRPARELVDSPRSDTTRAFLMASH
ncbi:MAG: dipeptide/oligopeptide/nickel ABC transporter ATP-binding protein [Phycisphaerales bacterium]|nr:dipeptide/oligopeptide/nickel ABC transporter ATP-binding protein [Phycisphaerales bacterium]